MGNMPRPLVEHSQPPTMLSSRPSSQPLQMHPNFGTPPACTLSAIGQPAQPFQLHRKICHVCLVHLHIQSQFKACFNLRDLLMACRHGHHNHNSDYIVKDTGNCSPCYMRCTINQIPCTVDLLSTFAMQLALLVLPLALPHPSEEPIQAVDFAESGLIRCSRCKGYINAFMKLIDQGRRFIHNFRSFTDETPRDYHCNLGDGRHRDADERPELCQRTVDFVASKEYMVRDPKPPVFFFLIDISMNAMQTGASAAACSAIKQVIADLPEGSRTLDGIATFDSTIHFYNLKRALQQACLDRLNCQIGLMTLLEVAPKVTAGR